MPRNDPPPSDDVPLYSRPSKTRLKQESHDLQALGEALLELPESRLAKVPMPEQLRDALQALRTIRSHEGRRRQLQFVGKLMRDTDPEPLREAVAAQRLPGAREALALHKAEAWRARLITSDNSLTEWLNTHPDVDAQALRNLIRNARRDAAQAEAARAPDAGVERKGRAYRELFQHVRETLARDDAAPSDEEGAMTTTPGTPAEHDPVKIGLVSVSDRASAGVYPDEGIPALQHWLARALKNPVTWLTRLIPDEQAGISDCLRQLVDIEGCHLVLTTGGTGPAPRDVTPEATLAIADKQMPGFGEQMRQISLRFVPTAILSRQVAVIRGQALVINLPGQPKAIAETLEGLPQATPPCPGIFAAVPYCIDLIGGPYLETDEAVIKAFRPKNALRRAQPAV